MQCKHKKTLIVSRGQSLACVASSTDASAQLNNHVLSKCGCFKQLEQRARWRAMDKVMKRLGIKVVSLQGKDVKPIVHVI
jgi:hypothetical protein